MQGKEIHKGPVEESLHRAVAVVHRGGVVAFPTETYYGLAADPFNSKAIDHLFTLKGRERHKPILLLLPSRKWLSNLVESIPQVYQPLMKKYWPGPLTLLFPAKKNINSQITAGTGTIGLRISPHPLAQQFCALWGKPITATSANPSGLIPANKSSIITNYFGDKIDFVLDGGPTPAGKCSTIAGIENGKLKLIRQGQIEFSKLLEILP